MTEYKALLDQQLEKAKKAKKAIDILKDSVGRVTIIDRLQKE